MQPLHYTVRRSPYFERTVELGAIEFMVYNHTYMPLDYGRDPREDYDAMVERVTLWDVGAERQCELRGPDAVRFADYLSPRAMADLPVGGCRFTPVCDDAGQVMADCVVLRPCEDVVWFSHGDVDLELWAHGLALAGGYDVAVSEADVPPMQLQGPRALDVLAPLTAADLAALPRFRCVETDRGGRAGGGLGDRLEQGAGLRGLSAGQRARDRDLGRDRRGRRAARSARDRPQRDPRGGAGNHRHAVPHELRDGPARGRAWEACSTSTGPTFVGREALRADPGRGPARLTLGLAGEPGEHDPLADRLLAAGAARRRAGGRRPLGGRLVRARAPDRDRAGRPRARSSDPAFVMQAPEGAISVTPHPFPFVGGMSDLPIVRADGNPRQRGRIIGAALADGHARSADFTRRYAHRHGLSDRDLEPLLAPYLAAARQARAAPRAPTSKGSPRAPDCRSWTCSP